MGGSDGEFTARIKRLRNGSNRVPKADSSYKFISPFCYVVVVRQRLSEKKAANITNFEYMDIQHKGFGNGANYCASTYPPFPVNPFAVYSLVLVPSPVDAPGRLGGIEDYRNHIN